MSLTEHQLDQVVRAFKDADGLLITAGAELGVDSGLPDFWGSEGFWKAVSRFKATFSFAATVTGSAHQ